VINIARVRIRNEDIEFEVPDGEMLMPYAKKHSSMLFGCEKGECGTCVCSVSKGTENVNIKTHKEEMTLAQQGAYPSARLACQIRIKKGEVEIEY
jgi:2Fe-2S ferredoxin